jgi:hypothetical protein
MARHASPKAKTLYRSDTAQQAYRAGAVTHTIDIARSPAFEVRQRASATLNRHALALGIVAAAFWIYDVGLLVTH